MTWDVAIVPQVHDWLLELRQDDPAALTSVSAALDLLGQDGPALGPPLVSAIASMTAIHAGLKLLRECDPRLVSFEVDIGWVVTAGREPIAFLHSLHGRAAQLHVKDVAPGNTVNFALSMKPAEVGSGTLDWAKILPAAYAAGVRHFYVEQEPPFAIPRMEAARKSYAFLSHLRA